MTFFICGVPGTGKTSIVSFLKNDFSVIELGNVIKEKKLYTFFDERTGSFVINEEEVDRVARGLYGENVIIEWIDLSFLSEQPNGVILLRTNPVVLKKRLESRNYPDSKVRENVMAELLGVIRKNLSDKWHDKTIDFDTTATSPKEAAEAVRDIITGKIQPKEVIDWLSIMDPEELDQLIGQLDSFKSHSGELPLS